MAGQPLTAQAVADLVGGRLSGSGEIVLHRVRSLERAGDDALAMYATRKYAQRMADSRAGAVLVSEALAGDAGPATRIIVADPARAIFVAARTLHPDVPAAPGIAATARIGRGAQLGPDATIGEYSVLGDGVRIGARARIGAHVVIEDGVTIGDDVRLDTHVTIYSGSELGSRVWCKASAVIGGPGFGYAADKHGRGRIPHVGACIIEDDVDIGSGTCIDRGSLDDTRIGHGTKIDNLVHLAHNVQTGPDCLIMAGTGIAGSTRLGARVTLAGQVGCNAHIELGDDVRVGGQSGVFADVPAGSVVSGCPARPHRDFLRAMATLYRLAPYGDALESVAKERNDG